MFAKIAHFSQKEKEKCNFFQIIAQGAELQEVTTEFLISEFLVSNCFYVSQFLALRAVFLLSI